MIVNKFPAKNEVRLSDVKCGSAFTVNPSFEIASVFIKSDLMMEREERKVSYACVNPLNGEATYMAENQMVYLVHAELNVSPLSVKEAVE